MSESTSQGERAPDELHGERFAIVPEPLLSEKADVVKLFAILDRYANREGRLWPGQPELAERMECSDRHIRRLLKRLQEVGAISEVKRRYNGSTVYELTHSRIAGLGSPVRPERGVRSEPTDRNGESAPSGPGSPPNESHERKPSSSKAESFVLSDALRQWAEDKYPAVNLDAEVEAFRDFHQAKGSTFKDWDAALRTWLHNSVKFATGRRPAQREEVPFWEAQVQ